MKIFHLEADMPYEHDTDSEPLRISIWADCCKIEQGLEHRMLFLTENSRVVAEIQGQASLVTVEETWTIEYVGRTKKSC